MGEREVKSSLDEIGSSTICSVPPGVSRTRVESSRLVAAIRRCAYGGAGLNKRSSARDTACIVGNRGNSTNSGLCQELYLRQLDEPRCGSSQSRCTCGGAGLVSSCAQHAPVSVKALVKDKVMTLFAHPLRPPHSPSASLDRQDSEALVESGGACTLLKGE